MFEEMIKQRLETAESGLAAQVKALQLQHTEHKKQVSDMFRAMEKKMEAEKVSNERTHAKLNASLQEMSTNTAAHVVQVQQALDKASQGLFRIVKLVSKSSWRRLGLNSWSRSLRFRVRKGERVTLLKLLPKTPVVLAVKDFPGLLRLVALLVLMSSLNHRRKRSRQSSANSALQRGLPGLRLASLGARYL